MNTAEALAREIARVTALEDTYRETERMVRGAYVAPAIALMDAAIERGCVAAGSNDATKVIAALHDLRGFTE